MRDSRFCQMIRNTILTKQKYGKRYEKPSDHVKLHFLAFSNGKHGKRYGKPNVRCQQRAVDYLTMVDTFLAFSNWKTRERCYGKPSDHGRPLFLAYSNSVSTFDRRAFSVAGPMVWNALTTSGTRHEVSPVSVSIIHELYLEQRFVTMHSNNDINVDVVTKKNYFMHNHIRDAP